MDVVKALKFRNVQEVHQISRKRLRQLMKHRKLVVKIKNGVAPDEAARIFRVLATYIDDERKNEK